MGRIAGHVLGKQAKAQKIADSAEHCITGKAPVRQAAKMLIVGSGENEPGKGTPPLLMAFIFQPDLSILHHMQWLQNSYHK